MATKNITFLEGDTAPMSSEPFTVGRFASMLVEISGTASSAKVNFKAVGASGEERPLAGVRTSDRAIATSGGINEVWNFDLTGWGRVIMEVESVTGGNITIEAVAGDDQVNMSGKEIRQAANKTLVPSFEIRAMGRKWGAFNLDFSRYASLVLRVDNNHDQPIDIILNRQDWGDFTGLDGTPLKVRIPAERTNVIVTPKDWTILGFPIADRVVIGFEAAAAPTYGDIVVVAYPTFL